METEQNTRISIEYNNIPVYIGELATIMSGVCTCILSSHASEKDARLKLDFKPGVWRVQ